MIIRSRFVKDDSNRERHLLSTSNNRGVIEHRDLDRGCPGELRHFLAFSSALTAAHPRAKITLAHFKISPSHPLARKQLLRTIARIKRENGIARGHPMRLIEHDKGDRPAHFHLLFSAVDPETGRVLSSKGNYARDELVSRLLEIAFGEEITPGPRVQRNAADLFARGNLDEAEILSGYAPVRRHGLVKEADRQQAARTKLPLAEFRNRLLSAIEKGVRSRSLPRALAAHGFSIAIGNRRETLLAVHGETGMALPFLSSVAIASDGRMELAPEAIEELRRDAPSLTQARREGAATTFKRARRDVDREIDRGRFEAAIDGDIDNVFSRMRRLQKKAEADNESAEMLRSQAALRRATLAARREATRVRQIRIDRAFRTARIVQSRRARRIAFAIAAGGMLLTGAGLSIALGVGVVATAALAGYGGALRIEAKALIAAGRLPVTATRDQVRRTIDAATVLGAGKAAAENPPSAPQDQPKAAGFDFASIRKSHRVLAAMAMEALSGKPIAIASDALERALGGDAIAGLAALVKDGSALQRRIVHSWNGSRSSDAFAAETALRRAGEREAAKIMAGIGRHRVAAERNQSTGRG